MEEKTMIKSHKVGVSQPPSALEDQDRNSSAKLPCVELSLVEDEDVRWGWLGFRPNILQHLLTPIWFLVFVSLFSLAQGMAINSFVSIAIPSLEKQFSFSSTQSGVIVSSNDVMGLLLVCFVSFRGDYGHKTKWLGYGALMTSIGCLLFALPSFLLERGDIARESQKSFAVCVSNTTLHHSYGRKEGCSTDGTDGTLTYLMIFILSQLLAGAGTTPLHTLGTSYIDENVDPKHTSIYIGVFYATIMLGPGLGSIIGGNMLTLYVDIKTPPNISSQDPAWIGAWWLGPLACGCLLFVVGIILLGFPRHLPHATRLRQEAINRGLIRKGEHSSGTMKDILPVTKSLLTNGTFMYQNMALTVSALIGGGLGPFLFKIIRTRYGATPAIIGLSIALILIPGAGGGIALGSFLVKKFCDKNSCKTAAKMSFSLQLIGVWTALIFLIPGCEYSRFAGIDKPYENSNATTLSIKDPCNDNCSCLLSTYKPLCGPRGINYFSPCLAGCTTVVNKSYTRCSCLSSPNTVLKPGLCDRHCKNLAYFLIGAVILSIFSFSNVIPSKIVTLRSVPDNQRGYALGLQFVFLRSLGSLPGPIVFGRLIDTTCTMWQTKCGRDGNCLNYDHIKLSWILIGAAMPTYALSCIAYFVSWYYSKKQAELQSNDVDGKNPTGKDHKDNELQLEQQTKEQTQQCRGVENDGASKPVLFR